MWFSSLRHLLLIISLACLSSLAYAISDAEIAAATAGKSPQEIEALKAQYGAKTDAAAPLAEAPVANNAVTVQPLVGAAPAPEKEPETALPCFGYDLFKGQNDFSSLKDVPVPQDYVLNIDDQIKITIYGKTTQKYLLFVGRDGSVEVPNVGNLSAAGMKFADFSQTASQKIREKFTGAEVNISLGQVGSMRVFVLGDAQTPGGYQMSSLATITQALQTAGGIRLTGSLRNIQVKRGGKTVARIDLYDLLLKGDNSQDIRLQNGDTVFVPPVGPRASIKGGVVRPAVYEIGSTVSFNELLALSGGYQSDAIRNQVSVTTMNSKGEKQTFVTSVHDRKLKARDGDLFYVPQSISAAGNNTTEVRVTGSLVTPFSHPWNANLRVLDVLSIGQVPVSENNQLYVVVKNSGKTGQNRARVVDIAAANRAPHSDANLLLQPNDEVIIHALDKRNEINQVLADLKGFTDELPYVQLSGAVKRAGAYPWQTSLTLSELIDAAGGFNESYKDSAYPLFVVVVSRDMTSAAHKIQSYDLKQLQQMGRSVPLSRNDVVVVFSKTDLDYLNSTDVRDALVGKATKPACSGIELLAQSSTQGIGRSFGHLRGMMQVTGEKMVSYQQSMACPAVFNDYPELLGYLLENSVIINGEVRKPAVLPVAQGTRLNDVIDYLGGFSTQASLRNVERTRYNEQSQSVRALVDLTQSAFLTEPLQGGDVYLIRPLDTDIEKGTVVLGGEVKYPGNYVIKKGETLSQLIARAGGLTDFAYPFGAVFTRESTRREQQVYFDKTVVELQEAMFTAQQLRRDQPANTAAGMDVIVKSLMESMKTNAPIGRMVIEADPLVLSSYPEMDITLEAGDRLFIPKRGQHVTVAGQVLASGSVLHRAELKAKDYIQKAGGVTRMADESQAFLILPNGEAQPVSLSSWNMADTSIPPGSTIYVPRDPLPFNAMAFGIDISKILSSLAITAASISVINR
jgi:protein involved in polysaccharide export with SLBB domain